jgi:carboxymethylenebutenolidase
MDQKIIDLYNDYIHGDMPRRSFLRRVANIAGGAAAASALLPLIECNYALAHQVDPKDERLVSGYERYPGARSEVTAYVARPARAKLPLPGMLVIHENRGLNAHIEDVARRAALAGYVAVAPDGLSYVGGAPRDQEAARDRFREADVDTITADVVRGVGYLKSRNDCTGKVGSVGFCYGGGVALQCAVAEPATDASVSFYGRALEAEQVARVNAPLMMHYAGNDPRVNAMIPDFRKALDQHGVAYSLHMYPGTGHGFHNDTSQARYDLAAAELAWKRTIDFFDHYLRGGLAYNSRKL